MTSPLSGDEHAALIARLLSERWLDRTDPAVQRALIDEGFRDELDRRLAGCGLRLLDNPFAAHVALALAPAQEAAVLRPDAQWLSNNAELPRTATALLVLLLALLVLPKREHQLAREGEGGQGVMFSLGKDQATVRPITEQSLLDDYSERLGGRKHMGMQLGRLRNLGFVEVPRGQVTEGPLLDLVFDYAALAPRLPDSVVADLALRRHAKQPPGSGAIEPTSNPAPEAAS